jgi:hypothetical protein
VTNANVTNVTVIHDEHRHRLDTKLKRELGEQVLALLRDERTEDIILNPGLLFVGQANGRRIYCC